MNHDRTLTDRDYNALDPRLRPITDDPIQLRRPRAIDDVNEDELEGFSVIELDYNEADDWLEDLDEPDLDDPAFRAFLDDLDTEAA